MIKCVAMFYSRLEMGCPEAFLSRINHNEIIIKKYRKKGLLFMSCIFWFDSRASQYKGEDKCIICHYTIVHRSDAAGPEPLRLYGPTWRYVEEICKYSVLDIVCLVLALF